MIQLHPIYTKYFTHLDFSVLKQNIETTDKIQSLLYYHFPACLFGFVHIYV